MTKFCFPIVLVGAAAVAAACTEARTADLQPPTPVKVHSVEAFSANNGLRYSATIRPAAQMELAFKNGGFVDAIYHVAGRPVDKGDPITKGAVLARVREADFQDRLDQASSQLQEARAGLESAKARAAENRARLERAEQDFNRAQRLFDSQSLTKPNYDMARAEYDAARSRVESAVADTDGARSRIESAESAVADARLAVQDTAIMAPMSGTILERKIEIGSLISAGKAAFVLANTNTVKAVFGVPDLEIRSVKTGMLLDMTSEAVPGQTFRGRITSISPAADEKSRIFETEVTIPNPNDMLKPGMIASVVIGKAASAEKFAAVPLSAIVRSKDGAETYAVFVVEMQGGQSVARLHTVELGDAFGNMIVVRSGLKIGQSVITVGATLVHDGRGVQIVP
jgi:RND family efflux transporter MFP subunit